MGEEEGKGKELTDANKQSTEFQAKVAADAAAAASAKAQKEKEDEDKANMKPDGNIHKNGQKYYADGKGLVGGVNEY